VHTKICSHHLVLTHISPNSTSKSQQTNPYVPSTNIQPPSALLQTFTRQDGYLRTITPKYIATCTKDAHQIACPKNKCKSQFQMLQSGIHLFRQLNELLFLTVKLSQALLISPFFYPNMSAAKQHAVNGRTYHSSLPLASAAQDLAESSRLPPCPLALPSHTSKQIPDAFL
jgi:hypothetical protein